MSSTSSLPQFVGTSCGHHGSYTFYKAFKYLKHWKYKVLTLGEFFFVRIPPDDDPCIGELQLLWEDKNSDQMLSSMRLYFLPEQTPEGRKPYHGEHEVLAASEKVILRLEDLVQWITEEVDWSHGLVVNSGDPSRSTSPMTSLHVAGVPSDHLQSENGVNLNEVFTENILCLDVAHVQKEKEMNRGVNNDKESSILVLSYARYCRYRAILTRLNGLNDKWLKNALVVALGGVSLPNRRTKVLFCRDTFDHDALANNDSNCDHLAPNLKGRPRKKKVKIKRHNSQSSESNASDEEGDAKVKADHKEEQEFLQNLFKFMKERNTPIHRVPHLGFKQIDLYLFFTCAQKFGGYEEITSKKLWKNIYDELGGNPGSTSAATCTRRHYERLLLSFERYVKGTEDPLSSAALFGKKKKKEESDQACRTENFENGSYVLEEVETSSPPVFDNDSCMSSASYHSEAVNQEERPKNHNVCIENEDSLQDNTRLSDLERQEQEWESRRRKNPQQKGMRDDTLVEKEKRWNEIRRRNALDRKVSKQVQPSRAASKSNSLADSKLFKVSSLNPGDNNDLTRLASSSSQSEISLNGHHLEKQENASSESVPHQSSLLHLQHFTTKMKDRVENSSEKRLPKYPKMAQIPSSCRTSHSGTVAKVGSLTSPLKFECSTASTVQEPKLIYKTSIMSPLFLRKRFFSRVTSASTNSNPQLSLLPHHHVNQGLSPEVSLSGSIIESGNQTTRGGLLGGKESLDLPISRPSVIHHTEKVRSPSPEQSSGFSQPIYERVSPVSEPASPLPLQDFGPDIFSKKAEHVAQKLPEFISRHSPLTPATAVPSPVSYHLPYKANDTISPLSSASSTSFSLLSPSASLTGSSAFLPSNSTRGASSLLPSDLTKRYPKFFPTTSSSGYPMSVPLTLATTSSLMPLSSTRSHQTQLTVAGDNAAASQIVSYTGHPNLLPRNTRVVSNEENNTLSALSHGALPLNVQYYNTHSSTSDLQCELTKTRLTYLSESFAHQPEGSHAHHEPISPVTSTPSPPLDPNQHPSHAGLSEVLLTCLGVDTCQALDLTVKKNSSALKQDPSTARVQEHKKEVVPIELEGCLDLSVRKKKQAMDMVTELFLSPVNLNSLEKTSPPAHTNSILRPDICQSHIVNEVPTQGRTLHLNGKVPIQTHIPRVNSKVPIQAHIPCVNSKVPTQAHIPCVNSKVPTQAHIPCVNSKVPTQAHIPCVNSKVPTQAHIPCVNSKVPTQAHIPCVNSKVPTQAHMPCVNSKVPTQAHMPCVNSKVPTQAHIPCVNSKVPTQAHIPCVNSKVPTQAHIPCVNSKVPTQAHMPCVNSKVPTQAHMPCVNSKVPTQAHMPYVNSKVPTQTHVNSKVPTQAHMPHLNNKVSIRAHMPHLNNKIPIQAHIPCPNNRDKTHTQLHATHANSNVPLHVCSQNTRHSFDQEQPVMKPQTINKATISSSSTSKESFLASDSSKKTAYVTEYNPQLPRFVNPSIISCPSPLLGQQHMISLEALQSSVAVCKDIIGRDIFSTFPQFYPQFYKSPNTP
ncbi:mucin-4-like isoform X5 [Limulus polyphemus]|uniref:Mucin-4-like isoform X5 n=1 Tax=Limulus polyphemus TaxID=6850 RepID=A0ABM1SPR8_LIMPO|nr:mucin-4-like isoform X5 [Limulus polyphemus]